MHRSLEGFKDYLSKQNILPGNQLPYVIWWVKHFKQPGSPEEAELSDILEEEGRKDWQIRMKEYILNWFNWPLTSAKLEAFNGKIRRLLKNTCGLRDQEYMFLRIRDLVDAKL